MTQNDQGIQYIVDEYGVQDFDGSTHSTDGIDYD